MKEDSRRLGPAFVTFVFDHRVTTEVGEELLADPVEPTEQQLLFDCVAGDFRRLDDFALAIGNQDNAAR